MVGLIRAGVVVVGENAVRAHAAHRAPCQIAKVNNQVGRTSARFAVKLAGAIGARCRRKSFEPGAQRLEEPVNFLGRNSSLRLAAPNI